LDAREIQKPPCCTRHQGEQRGAWRQPRTDRDGGAVRFLGRDLVLVVTFMSACVEPTRARVVELETRVLGLGITLTGTTLRALDVVGLAAGAVKLGFGFDFFLVSDGAGKLQAKNPLPPARAGLPAAVGIKRPLFANLMTEAAEAKGASIRYGLTVEAIDQNDAAVSVRFTDGSSGHYDLVVGADGVFSSIRKRVFGEAYEPIYVGQGVYRFMTERHPSIDQLHVFVGPKLKAGFIPLSDDSMYLFTTMSYPPHTRIDESKTHIILKEALKDFTAPIVVEVRERMRSPEKVIWRPFENTLVPSPWYRGRVILIGDAAHTLTPHLTAGGGMAIEDAETLGQARSVPDALQSFMERRFERVRAACDISLEICKLEQAPEPDVAKIYSLTGQGYALLGKNF
jgi:2-polyprenyl-6-methoxyphenol hydroxylase-like FAD-dependent oxidoreductase